MVNGGGNKLTNQINAAQQGKDQNLLLTHQITNLFGEDYQHDGKTRKYNN